jgi:hypothetical protein
VRREPVFASSCELGVETEVPQPSTATTKSSAALFDIDDILVQMRRCEEPSPRLTLAPTDAN